MSSVFESIKQGLNEAIEYERGNLSNPTRPVGILWGLCL